MKQKLRFILFYVALSFSATLYAGTNVGLTDFGRVADQSDSHNMCRNIQSKYLTPGQAKSNLIVQGDVYEVILKRVHIDKDYNPGFLEKRARIALVTRGFEMVEDKSNSAIGFDYSPKSADSGRVIYYSEDVRPGQFLNFGQLTMFGPVEFHGNPLGISLFAIEIDGGKSSEKISALLSTLAGLGKQFSVPSSPILGVLDALGTNLIRGNKDDLLMRYDTSVSSGEVGRPELYGLFHQYGEYIMVRMENRNDAIKWAEFKYNPSSGVLYKGDSCDAKNEYTGTYTVVQVNKGLKEAFVNTQSLSELRNLMAAVDKEDMDAFNETTSKISTAILNGQLYKSIRKSITVIETSKVPESYQYNALKKSLMDVNASIVVLKGGPKLQDKTYLTQTQVDAILAQLNKIANSATLITQDDFNADVVIELIKNKGKT